MLADLLASNRPPKNVPNELANHPRFQEIEAYLLDVQRFVLLIANGDLSTTLLRKGYMAGCLKSLQASLCHLTWQTKMIAQGNLNQCVDFMGEFRISFNSMVRSLEQTRRELKECEEELSQANATLSRLYAEARSAQDSAEAANRIKTLFFPVSAMSCALL